jgi:hypothetical protein
MLTNVLPYALSPMRIPKEIDALGRVPRLSIHKGIGRLQFPLSRRNGIKIRA